MDGFTRREADGDLLSPDSKARIITRKMRLDSKGRISLPADLRRNFGLGSNSDIVIAFNLKKNLIFLLIGQDGVMASTGACGAFSPGSKARFFRELTLPQKAGEQKVKKPAEIPGPDPGKVVRRMRGYGNSR